MLRYVIVRRQCLPLKRSLHLIIRVVMVSKEAFSIWVIDFEAFILSKADERAT